MVSLYKLLFGDNADPRVEIRERFGTDNDPAGEKTAIQWAQIVIHSRGVDADDQTRVIRELRRANHDLSLKVARYLAVRVFQTEGTA